MKISFSVFSDSFFAFFASFFLSFVILCYFIPSNFAATFSCVFALLFTIIIIKNLLKKDGEKRLKREDELKKSVMLTQFNCGSKIEVNDFFQKVFLSRGLKTERKKGGIFIIDKLVAIFPIFCFREVGKAEVVRIFNLIKSTETAYILSEKFSADTISFAARFCGKIVLVDANEIYSYLKENNHLPPEKHKFKSEKVKGINLLKNLLNKKKAKSFFAFGILFLLYSFFVPIKLYYIVFGCTFLIFALFLRFFGKVSPA